MILITGASGTVGREVLGQILKDRKRSDTVIRAMYRKPEEAAKAPAGAQGVVADFTDKASLLKALEGVDSVFLVCAPVRELPELEITMLEACKESRVRHVVQSSALGAGNYTRSFPSWHRRVEDRLVRSRMTYTILRPNSFMQNLLAFYAPTIRKEGAFYAAMNEAQVSFIDTRDVASVAVKALLSRDFDGKTYDLNGPEALTYTQLAKKIERQTGRAVRYVNISEEAQRKAMLDAGMPDWQATALVDLQRYYKNGMGGVVDGILQHLLDHSPITMDQFLAEHEQSFRA